MFTINILHLLPEEEININTWEWDRKLLEADSDLKITADYDIDLTQLDSYECVSQEKILNGSGPINYDFDSVVVLENGGYKLFNREKNLYSNYKVNKIVNTGDNINDVNVVDLDTDAIHSSVQAALYRRNNKNQVEIYKEIKFVNNFTGVISGGVRLEASDNDFNITWANIDERKREYIINGSDTLICNQDFSINIGKLTTPVTTELAESLLEYAGAGYTEKEYFTEFFPIELNTTEVYSIDNNGDIYEWSEVTLDFYQQPSDERVFVVNHINGQILLGGIQRDPLILRDGISAVITSLRVYTEEHVQDWPSRGTLIIGSEEINYLFRDGNWFNGLIRGANSTVAAIHAAGSTVYFKQQGMIPTKDERFFIAYKAVPLIEYEVQTKDLNFRSDLEIEDITLKRGIIQIDPTEKHVESLILSIDQPLLKDNLYGEFNFGRNIARLACQALDKYKNGVEEVEITFQMEVPKGAINGANEYTKLSGSDGWAFTYYTAPYESDIAGQYITSLVQDAGDTILYLEDPLDDQVIVSDITVYQVLKHDLTFGNTGIEIFPVSSSNTPLFGDGNPMGASEITVSPLRNTYLKGKNIIFVGFDNLTYTDVIFNVLPNYNANGILVSHTLILEEEHAILDSGTPSQAWFSNDNSFDSQDDGVKVLIYKWDASAINPITEIAGAYMPVLPDTQDGSSITFNSTLLPEYSLTDRNNNVGGYYVVAPSIVEFYATCQDINSGRTIESNRIRLYVTLPNYLRGLHYGSGLPVPNGFNLSSSIEEYGGGLNGSNFITINPQKVDANIFNMGMEFG